MNALRAIQSKSMPKRIKQLLSEFGWMESAQENWPVMTPEERRKVVRAAEAEEASNVAYNRAASTMDKVEARVRMIAGRRSRS